MLLVVVYFDVYCTSNCFCSIKQELNDKECVGYIWNLTKFIITGTSTTGSNAESKLSENFRLSDSGYELDNTYESLNSSNLITLDSIKEIPTKNVSSKIRSSSTVSSGNSYKSNNPDVSTAIGSNQEISWFVSKQIQVKYIIWVTTYHIISKIFIFCRKNTRMLIWAERFKVILWIEFNSFWRYKSKNNKKIKILFIFLFLLWFFLLFIVIFIDCDARINRL